MKIKSFLFIAVLFYSCTLSYAYSIAPITRAPASNTPKSDTVLKSETENPNTGSETQGNKLGIDTALNIQKQETALPVVTDTAKKPDSSLTVPVSENVLTNTKLFIYIILSVLGLALFFFIFVINLFKTFHKKKSTRQSLLLSWNLFFVVSIIWLFIIWGLLAGFWTSASFMVVMIFLFIISLIMTIIAVKSR